MFMEAMAVANFAVGGLGTILGNSAAKKQAQEQAAYNARMEIAQKDHRVEVLAHQNKVWQQDLDHAGDMLSWAQGEWDRQVHYDTRARAAVEKNTLAAVGHVMLRQVEEDMAVIAAGFDTQRQGKQARAKMSAAAGDRGVEGNSVDAILGDVFRQEGEVVNVMAMNRTASIRQLNREAIALDAQGDQQLAALQVKTYAPSVQIRSPAPVAQVQPAAPVAQPSNAALITGLAGAAVQGFQNYSTWSERKMADVASDIGGWVSRQFTIPTPGG